jgi:beta-fructofuranosidase
VSGPVGRPRFHVTPPAGWINDPLGVTWHEGPDGGRYELFVQYNPDAPVWSAACCWGQLHSPDLVRWEWAGTALAPGPGETGCWSGSVIVRDDGVPVIVYTSVLAGQLDAGRIALATGEPGWRLWAADVGGPVLSGPPPELGMTHFRDPWVWRSGEGWHMAVGGGLTDGRAVALQYSSADLRHWDLDGVLADRSAAETEPVWSGSVWECVQFFPLDDRWILLVSAWHEGAGLRVLGAVGDYDGRRFLPSTWQRLTATDAHYATTSFLDGVGQRCAISWLRETGPAGAPWAGMLSLPVVLTVDGNRVAVTPHPAIDSLRGHLLASLGPTALTAEPLALGAFDPWLDVELTLRPGAAAVRIAVGDPEVLTLLIEPPAGVSVVSRPGRPAERIPLGAPRDGALRVRVLLDAGVAEVFSGGATGAVGVDPVAGPVPIVVSAPGGRGALEELTVFALPPG